MSRIYDPQEVKLILNLKDYFKRERANGGPLIPLNALNERVANAVQIGISTVRSIMKSHSNGVLGPIPPKVSSQTRKVIFNLDETTITEIRNIIFDMVKNKEQVNMNSINTKLHEKGLVKFCNETLTKVIRHIGFKYSREGLMEFPSIAILRTNFLVNYMREKFVDNRRQFVYLDESLWIIEKGTGTCIKRCSRHKTVRMMKKEGKRYIVLSAGNEHGFLPGATLILSSKNFNPDNRPEITDQSFLKWFEEQLLQKLDKPSVILINDDTYRSTVSKNYPNANWTKSDIKNWLQERLIFYHNNLLKSQLLGIVNRNLPPKQYEVVELATKYGHEVLRVPPFHFVFNPIETVWSIINKNYNESIVKEDKGFDKALSKFEETLTNAGPDTWQKSVESTEIIIKNWWDREIYFDQADSIPAMLDIGQESDLEDSDFESESDSDYEYYQNELKSSAKKSSKKSTTVSEKTAPSTSTNLFQTSEISTSIDIAK